MPPKNMPSMATPMRPSKLAGPAPLSPPSGDAKIDLILKRLDRLEQALRDVRLELEGVAAEHTDRIVRTILEK